MVDDLKCTIDLDISSVSALVSLLIPANMCILVGFYRTSSRTSFKVISE